MLGLQAHAAVPAVRGAALADDGAVKPVGGGHLQAGFSGEDIHDSAGAGIFKAGRQDKSGALTVQHEVVVVAGADLQLLVVLSDSCANASRRPEVEWCSRYGRSRSRGYLRRFHWCVAIGVHSEPMVQDVFRLVAREIEVAVLRQV